MLKRRPNTDAATDDFDAFFGAVQVGRIYRNPGTETWHWRIFVTLAETVVDARDRASARESATAAFRERWDQLKLAERLG